VRQPFAASTSFLGIKLLIQPIVRIILAASCAILIGMIGCATEVTTSTKLQAGNWEMKFEVGDDANRVYIPIDIRVDSLGKITIHNDTEVIQLTEVIHKGDSVHARVAPYLSYLHWKEFNGDSISGYWEDASRDNYKVLFTATPHSENDVVKKAWQKTFDATFSYGTPDQYKAVGIFDRSDNDLSGTFMTETGDYRYLGGDIIDVNDGPSKMSLSCFDGAHLFYFTADVYGDSIKNGMFYSGKHYSEKWNAVVNENAALRDPDSLTILNPGYTSLEFEVRKIEGDTVWFDSVSMGGKVTIVEIFGSWCPNCSDETRFLKTLHEKFGADKLNIIPVAFERGDTFEKQKNAFVNYIGQFEMPFPAYIGGTSSKSECGKVFPALNSIMSYPTTVFLDKKGRVRKIHTGFYGPSTGKYHEFYTERIRLFVEQLINE